MELALGGELLARVVPFVPRETLFLQRIDSEAEVARVTRELCEALTYLHSRGIVHRDLKPRNIMYRQHTRTTHVPLEWECSNFFVPSWRRSRTPACTSLPRSPANLPTECIEPHNYPCLISSRYVCLSLFGNNRDLRYASKSPNSEIKITDFGLAFRGDVAINECCGTPQYVSPEVLEKQPVTSSSDMWSLGVILYLLLCGFLPFYARDRHKLESNIKHCLLEFPSPFWDSISDSAKHLISGLLCLDPTRRLTASQVLEHPFVTGEASPVVFQVQEGIQVYLAKAALRRTVYAIASLLRVARLAHVLAVQAPTQVSQPRRKKRVQEFCWTNDFTRKEKERAKKASGPSGEDILTTLPNLWSTTDFRLIPPFFVYAKACVSNCGWLFIGPNCVLLPQIGFVCSVLPSQSLKSTVEKGIGTQTQRIDNDVSRWEKLASMRTQRCRIKTASFTYATQMVQSRTCSKACIRDTTCRAFENCFRSLTKKNLHQWTKKKLQSICHQNKKRDQLNRRGDNGEANPPPRRPSNLRSVQTQIKSSSAQNLKEGKHLAKIVPVCQRLLALRLPAKKCFCSLV